MLGLVLTVSRPKKLILAAASVPLVLGLLLLGTISVRYGPRYTYRLLAHMEPTIKDPGPFPTREIRNRPPVFDFKRAAQPVTIDKVTHAGKTIDFESFLAESETRAIIVIKDDTILYERYLRGDTRESANKSFSMAKSITSTLVGLAVHDGLFRLDDPIVTWLPELKGRGLDAMTVRDLLVMSSGIEFELLPGDEFLLFQPFYGEAIQYYLPDIRSHLLELRAGREKLGEYFLYDDYHPLLEAMIIERTSHQTLSAYAEEKLWSRIGAEFPASFSLNDEDGLEQAASGFNARPIDLARFARLFLDDNEVLPPGWAKEATAPDPDDHRPWKSAQTWRDAGGYYKYHWWGLKNEDGTYDFTATGSPGAQIIYVSPSRRAIVVHQGTGGDPMTWAMVARSIIRDLN